MRPIFLSKETIFEVSEGNIFWALDEVFKEKNSILCKLGSNDVIYRGRKSVSF